LFPAPTLHSTSLAESETAYNPPTLHLLGLIKDALLC